MAMSSMYSLEWRSPSLPTRHLQTTMAGRRFILASPAVGRRGTSKHCTIRTYCAATTESIGEMGRKAQFVDVFSSPTDTGYCAATATTVARRRSAENDVVGEMGRKAQRALSPAAVLGIGTANPVNCVRQDQYPDYYFRLTQSAHLPELKAKMKRLCDKSGIEKRYFHHTEKMIRDHPEFLDRTLSSVDPRQDILRAAVPDLAAAAALDAVSEWGRPASDITHLIMSTYSGAHMPGADLGLSNLLGLRPSVQRTMLYLSGCTSASTALRLAKDIAENNRGARVLVACAELTLTLFRGPEGDDASSLDTVIMQSLFGDGAGAVIVGADSDKPVERPLFDMVSASQTMIPEMGEQPAAGQLSEAGMVFHPSRAMPTLVRQKIEQCILDGVHPVYDLGLSGGWNDLFWAVQPTGRAVLDGVQAGLGLQAGKLDASRRVLRDYGYMSGASMIYVLDELRRRSACHGPEGLPGALGVMLGIGPGFSVETMLMRRSSE